MSHEISRRSLVRGGLAAAVLVGIGTPLLAGCTATATPGGTAGAGATGALVLPTYVRYNGVKPDLAGNKQGVMDAFLKYPASPVKSVSKRPGDGKPITGMTQTYSPIPPGVDQNPYWQELNKRLGSDWKPSLASPGDYAQKFATTVAGNTLPDMFNLGAVTVPQLDGFLAAKAVDLTPYLSGDAVKKYPNLANLPTTSWKGTVYNNKIMGIPIPRGVAGAGALYYRSDIFESEGISTKPSSFEEWFALCKQLTAPRNNKWALAGVPIDYLRQMHKIPLGWSLKNGKLTSANEHPRQKDALEAGRKLVTAGVVEPSTFSITGTEFKTWFLGGRVAMNWDALIAWGQYYGSSTDPNLAINVLSVPAFSGSGSGSAWLGSASNSITAINKGSKDRVETLLEVMNYFAAPFGTEEHRFLHYGVAGVDYVLKGTDPVMTARGDAESNLGTRYMADQPGAVNIPGNEQATRNYYDAQKRLVATGVRNPTDGVYSATQASVGATIGGALVRLQGDILQGRAPVSAWDAGVKQWKSGGGDKIRDELQKALS